MADGVLVIDKPAGPTSHDVVVLARRALRERRIGHTGTLDPLATGVLPLVIGKATRLASLMSSSEKEYVADVRLGAATATYDAADRFAAGDPAPPPPDVTLDEVQAALAAFRGSFDQLPPPYSAKKVDGVPAYKLARKNAPTELKAVPVTVHALDVISYEAGLLRLRVVSSAGFYVRSLAHDVGAALGCGGHLEALRRTRAGAFGLDEAVPLGEVLEHPDTLPARVIPLSQLLPDVPAVVVNERGLTKVSHGNPLDPGDLAQRGSGPDLAASAEKGGQAPFFPAPFFRVLDGAGQLLAIAAAGPDGALRPSIVLV